MSPADVAERIRDGLRCDRPGCACRRATGNVHCPGHDDPNPSLSVTAKDGRALWRCYGGCEQVRVRDALVERGLWPPAGKKVAQNGASQPPPERRWAIIDPETGELLATHCRKDLPPQDGKAHKRVWWEPRGTKRVELPLYRAERLDGAEVVVVCEGEPAADAGAALLAGQAGAAVVGTVCGAAVTPSDRSLERLPIAATIVLWADADAPGRYHMRRIGNRLIALGYRDVKLLDATPETTDGSDAADLLAAGATTGAVIELWRGRRRAGGF